MRRNGRRVHISTGCSTLAGAKAELARYEVDPEGYSPGGSLDGSVQLTPELILQYRKHQLAAGITKEWTDNVARLLLDWRDELGARDLRALKLHRDLRPALDKWEAQRPHRIKAIKGLFRWLRQEQGLVDRNQDATLDLKVPQASPEKLRRRKIVPVEDVAATLNHLPEVTRDILHLLSATAWHVSEVRKFAEAGEIRKGRAQDNVLAVLITRHKSGDFTKTPILYPEHLAAAERIRAMASFPKRITIARHMRKATKAAGVHWFGMGQMRHSVLTWGVQDGGASIQLASEFAHHRNRQTTERFYLDLDVPRAALPVYRLTEG